MKLKPFVSRIIDMKLGVKVRCKKTGKIGEIISHVHEINLRRLLLKRGHTVYPPDWKKVKLISFDEGFIDIVINTGLEIVQQ